MKRHEKIGTTEELGGGCSASAERRASLVEAMVRGAILPQLLARKDQGHFDRGPNVVRLPRRDDA